MGWIALGTRFYWMNKPFHTAEAKSMNPRHRFQGSYQYDQGLRHEPHPHGLE